MIIQYVVYGQDKLNGPKMYGVSKKKTEDRGFEVAVWACDINGDQVSDNIEYADGLKWIAANKLFWKYYRDYDKYVNNRCEFFN